MYLSRLRSLYIFGRGHAAIDHGLKLIVAGGFLNPMMLDTRSMGNELYIRLLYWKLLATAWDVHQ